MTGEQILQAIEKWCAILMLLGIPSIINGFLRHAPVECQSVAGKILEMIAVLARRNSPQTFKAPLTLSAEPVAPFNVDVTMEGANAAKQP